MAFNKLSLQASTKGLGIALVNVNRYRDYLRNREQHIRRTKAHLTTMAPAFNPPTTTVLELQSQLQSGSQTSVQIVEGYLMPLKVA